MSFLLLLSFSQLIAVAQSSPQTDVNSREIIFVSDTQQPMWVEKLFLKSNHNVDATKDIFAAILQTKP